MPFYSKQQARFFYAAANKKKGIKGLSQEDAQKFIDDTDHQKISKLPKFVKLKNKIRSK